MTSAMSDLENCLICRMHNCHRTHCSHGFHCLNGQTSNPGHFKRRYPNVALFLSIAAWTCGCFSIFFSYHKKEEKERKEAFFMIITCAAACCAGLFVQKKKKKQIKQMSHTHIVHFIPSFNKSINTVAPFKHAIA